MTPTPSGPAHVVIVGGGVAGVEALLALHDLAEHRAHATLVAPQRDFVLRPMRTAEPFSTGRVQRRPLGDIAAQVGAEHLYDTVERVDPQARRVECATGATLGYDVLVLAPGARPRAAYEHALTFGLAQQPDAFQGLLADLEQHYTRSVAFVVPPGVSWSLPAYELALMTARHVRSMGIDDAQLTIVTPESAPLQIFGTAAAAAVAGLLEHAGVSFVGDADGPDAVEAQRIVALPRITGPALPGVPCDEEGFIPIDGHARVQDLDGVYAAGDAADYPVKQGGIACQQADAAASHIAAALGAPFDPEPFQPVLRGKLLTGEGAEYLRRDLGHGDPEGRASELDLWFPPAKVAGRYLGEWLAKAASTPVTPPPVEHVEVEVPLPPGLRTRDDPMALDPLGPLPHHRHRGFS